MNYSPILRYTVVREYTSELDYISILSLNLKVLPEIRIDIILSDMGRLLAGYTLYGALLMLKLTEVRYI
jgi:hypothetical protein